MLFREATIHGSLPWVADYTRRSLMFSYVPMHMALAPQGYAVVMEPCEHHTKSRCCRGSGCCAILAVQF